MRLIFYLICGGIVTAQTAFILSPSFLRPGGAAAITLLTDLKGHWKLDEASGTRVDSHSTNNLTANPTVAQVAGKIDNACDFQGGSLTGPNVGGLKPSLNSDMTVAGWVFFDAVTGEQALVSHYNAKGYVVQTSGASLIYYVDGTGGLDSVTSGVTLTNSGWFFFVAWHDATADTINIQVNDGTVASDGHTDGIDPPTDFFALGNQTASSRPLNGRLDSVSVWMRVLSASERTALYNSGNGLNYPF